MGVSIFYRRLSERYPCVNERLDGAGEIKPFDNLYLDMNGIIYNCVQATLRNTAFFNDQEFWVALFHYIDSIVAIIQPKKLVYLAVDGVAPRARLNQQRVARFRVQREAAEKDAKRKTVEMREQATSRGGFEEASYVSHAPKVAQDGLCAADAIPNPSQAFADLNCIAPGTEFMRQLRNNVLYYLRMKLHQDCAWANLRVIFSGPDVPGEAQHKLMDYIRRCKSQPDYDTETRHCFYGSNADLILLALASHEPYFSLLREELDFGKTPVGHQMQSRIFGKEPTFWLFHLGMLREYIALDLCTPRGSDDDNLPVKESASSMEELPVHGTSELSSPTVAPVSSSGPSLLKVLGLKTSFAEFDLDRAIDDLILCFFIAGNDFLPHFPFAEIGDGGVSKVFDVYQQYLHAHRNSEETRGKVDPWLSHDGGTIVWSNFVKFLRLWEAAEKDSAVHPARCQPHVSRTGPGAGGKSKCGQAGSIDVKAVDRCRENVSEVKPCRNDAVSLNAADGCSTVRDTVLEVDMDRPAQTADEARQQYYKQNFGFDVATPNGALELDALVQAFLEGLQWNLWYYTRGVPSWSWCYPFHYPPCVDSLLGYPPLKTGSFEAKLSEDTQPLLPFQHLMCVLPPSSVALLPAAYRSLMLDVQSPVKHMFPETFGVDGQRTAVSSGTVMRVPLIDETQLVAAMRAIEQCYTWTDEEKERNSVGSPVVLREDGAAPHCVSTPLPNLFKPIEDCRISQEPYEHPGFPEGRCHVQSRVTSVTNPRVLCVPSLQDMIVTRVWFDRSSSEFSTNVVERRRPTLHLRLTSALSSAQHLPNEPAQFAGIVYDYIRALMTGGTVFLDYPTCRLGKPVALWAPSYYLRCVARAQQVTQRRKLRPMVNAATAGKDKEQTPVLSAFLYRSHDMPDGEKHSTTLESEWAALKRRGVQYDPGDCSASCAALQVALTKALGYRQGRKPEEASLFGSASVDQILVEVLPVSETVVLSSGTCYKFGSQPVFRPLPFVLPDVSRNPEEKKPLMDVLRIGSRVMCVNEYSPLLGCTGMITRVGTSPGTTESLLDVRQHTYDERWTNQNELLTIVARDLQDFAWYSLDEVARQLDIASSVVAWITRSVWVYCQDERATRYDVGTNLVYTNAGRMLCIPTLTSFVPNYDTRQAAAAGGQHLKLLFSKYAVNLLGDYAHRWPEVIKALSRSKHAGRVNEMQLTKPAKPRGAILTASFVFPNHSDPDSVLEELARWCQRQPFSRQAMAGPSTEALSLEGVHDVERRLNAWARERETGHFIQMKGLREVFPVEVTGSLPDGVLAASLGRFVQTQRFACLGHLVVGQRVVYVKWKGRIPFGSFGCVTATTLEPGTLEQWVEVITDQPYLGCTDLNGRCSHMRGIRVPASSLMCLRPVVCPWGLSIPTLEEYQRLIQAAVQRLERGEPNDMLRRVTPFDSLVVRSPKRVLPSYTTTQYTLKQGDTRTATQPASVAHTSHTNGAVASRDQDTTHVSSGDFLGDLFKQASARYKESRNPLSTAAQPKPSDIGHTSTTSDYPTPPSSHEYGATSSGDPLVSTSCGFSAEKTGGKRAGDNVLQTLERLLQLKSSLRGVVPVHQDTSTSAKNLSLVPPLSSSRFQSPTEPESPCKDHPDKTGNRGSVISSKLTSHTVPPLSSEASLPKAGYFYSSNDCSASHSHLVDRLRRPTSPQETAQASQRAHPVSSRRPPYNARCPRMGIVTSTRQGGSIYADGDTASRQQVADALAEAVPVLRTHQTFQHAASCPVIAKPAAGNDLLELIRSGVSSSSLQYPGPQSSSGREPHSSLGSYTSPLGGQRFSTLHSSQQQQLVWASRTESLVYGSSGCQPLSHITRQCPQEKSDTVYPSRQQRVEPARSRRPSSNQRQSQRFFHRFPPQDRQPSYDGPSTEGKNVSKQSHALRGPVPPGVIPTFSRSKHFNC